MKNVLHVKEREKMIKKFGRKTIKKIGRHNKGAYFGRIKFGCLSSKREGAFSSAWREINKRVSFLNYGFGTLENLFIHHEKMFVVTALKIKSRDRFIAATVIQWLGTNVGFCWLEEVLGELGYKLEKKKEAN